MDADPAKLLLNRKEAAAILGKRPCTLREWYARGVGPPAVKHGSARQARIFYLRADLENWCAAGCPMGHGARPLGIPIGRWSADARGPRGRFAPKPTEVAS
jgi:hypothetical protein